MTDTPPTIGDMDFKWRRDTIHDCEGKVTVTFTDARGSRPCIVVDGDIAFIVRKRMDNARRNHNAK